jgi:hypothetical protein
VLSGSLHLLWLVEVLPCFNLSAFDELLKGDIADEEY